MTERVRWDSHNGVKFLYCDYSNITDEAEYAALLARVDEKTREEIRTKPEKIRSVINIADSIASRALKQKGREMLAATKKQGIESVCALYGVSAVMRVVVNAVSTDLHVAGSLEEAKDWVAEA